MTIPNRGTSATTPGSIIDNSIQSRDINIEWVSVWLHPSNWFKTSKPRKKAFRSTSDVSCPKNTSSYFRLSLKSLLPPSILPPKSAYLYKHYWLVNIVNKQYFNETNCEILMGIDHFLFNLNENYTCQFWGEVERFCQNFLLLTTYV